MVFSTTQRNGSTTSIKLMQSVPLIYFKGKYAVSNHHLTRYLQMNVIVLYSPINAAREGMLLIDVMFW